MWLAAERALDSRRARDVALLGTAIGLQVLAGSPDMCAMTLLAIAAWTLAVHVRWHEPRAALRLAAGAGAALLLAAALSAGLWVSSLELLLRSGRAALPDATRTYWSVHPVSLLETFLAGVPSQLPLQPAARQALFEGREPFLPSLYLGLPAIALVAAGLFGRAPRRRRLALGGLLLGAALFALGRHAPLYDLLTTLAAAAARCCATR